MDRQASGDFKSFIGSLSKDYPQFKFITGRRDYWSPKINTIIYCTDRGTEEVRYSLLHELSHALLGHSDYKSDFELLKLESEAWELAASIAPKYGFSISEDHIQNCLDTYRDWLHRRSTCPVCGMHVLQDNSTSYHCFNCDTQWTVTNKRFARAYRKTSNKKTR